jgi:transcriptional regulator with XRE-family HTH domain
MTMTRLEQLRLDAGLTRRQLALEAGVDQRAVARAEERNGGSPPMLAKIGRHFDVPAHTLLLPVEPEIGQAA